MSAQSPRARPGDVHIEVDTLHLEGVDIVDPAAFGAAVTAELTRLVQARGLPTGRRPGEPDERRTPQDDGALARAVAESVWRQLPSAPHTGGTR